MKIKLAVATNAAALERFSTSRNSAAEPTDQTLTSDQGKKIARQVHLATNPCVMVWFCNPGSTWYRNAFEHPKGQIRRYPTEGTDMPAHNPEQLYATADLHYYKFFTIKMIKI